MYRLFAFGLLLFPFINNAQEFNFSNLRTKQNRVFYAGTDNIFSCVVEGQSCSSIVLTSKKVNVRKMGCDYVFRSTDIGLDTIVIRKKVNNNYKKVGQVIVEVRPIPNPTAVVGTYTGGRVARGAFIAQDGIGCNYATELGFELSCKIDSFSFTIIRDNKIIAHTSNKGNTWSEETRKWLAALQKGDRVLISGITSKLPDGTIYSIAPLEFVID